MNKKYSSELSSFRELFANLQDIIPGDAPEKFFQDYNPHLEKYISSITNLLLVDEDKFQINLERAGESLGEMAKIIIGWVLPELEEEEEEISRYVNTEEIVPKFKKIGQVLDKASLEMENNDYLSSSNYFLECLESITNLMESLTNKKEGSRNIIMRSKRQGLFGWAGYILSFILNIPIWLFSKTAGILIAVILLNVGLFYIIYKVYTK